MRGYISRRFPDCYELRHDRVDGVERLTTDHVLGLRFFERNKVQLIHQCVGSHMRKRDDGG